MRPLVILRPEPGAGRTAARAAEMGLAAQCVPLFAARALGWTPPDPALFDALLMTSAQAARMAGPDLARYRALPAYAVGPATAAAMADHGLTPVAVGDDDGTMIAARIAADGHRRLLHLSGSVVAPFERGPLHVRRVPVYTMDEIASSLPPFPAGAVLLVHSARAGARLARLTDPRTRAHLHIVAISDAARTAAGTGWAGAHAVDQPRDEAMLVLAIRLCE
ncbi:MAG: uroporphyrinogen-III synthase [Sphingobium sp.]